MEFELADEDGSIAHYWQNVDRDELAQEWERFGPLGPPLTPAGQDAMQRRHVDWLDAQIQDERISPESRFRFLRVRGVVSQRAGDLVGALLARARQTRRSPRAREQRSRRSGPPSRDGPGDGEDDEPDDVDGARRRSS
jgi:hypothetical protein